MRPHHLLVILNLLPGLGLVPSALARTNPATSQPATRPAITAESLRARGPMPHAASAPAHAFGVVATRPSLAPGVPRPTIPLPAGQPMVRLATRPAVRFDSAPATHPYDGRGGLLPEVEVPAMPPAAPDRQNRKPGRTPATPELPPEHPQSGPAAIPADQRPLTLASTRPATQPASGPNIVLFFADDQGPGLTGFEGNATARTPRLDALAAGGASFTRTYTPTPGDAPSQCAVLTGHYPHKFGVAADNDVLDPYADTFTARLWRAGYLCGIVGNLCLPESQSRDPGFGLAAFVAADDGQWEHATTWVNGKEGRADQTLLDWQGDRAVEFIEKHHDRPFFLWLCFRGPREPWDASIEPAAPPEENGRPRRDHERTTPPRAGENASRPRKFHDTALARAFPARERSLAEDQAGRSAMITRLDANVGKVLDRLAALGLDDKTVVIFTSGNGFAMGEHQLYGKGPAFYEELVRVPLVIRYPQRVKPGLRIDRVVSLIDLAPTMLDLAGLPRPMTMQGDSLLPLLRDPDMLEHGDEAFFEAAAPPEPGSAAARPVNAPFARGVVTRNYKFIDYLDGSSSLYDLKRDPAEQDDIAAILANKSHPRYAECERNYTVVQRILRDRLTFWRKQTKDLQ